MKVDYATEVKVDRPALKHVEKKVTARLDTSVSNDVVTPPVEDVQTRIPAPAHEGQDTEKLATKEEAHSLSMGLDNNAR
ncbi:hypothetical protein A2U01_0038889, partial [Trifolium medium]|nr:hypothetical protein [Trifolium medium]